MDKKLRARLEAAGYKVGDVVEFLGLTEEEAQEIEVRLITRKHKSVVLDNREATNGQE